MFCFVNRKNIIVDGTSYYTNRKKIFVSQKIKRQCANAYHKAAGLSIMDENGVVQNVFAFCEMTKKEKLYCFLVDEKYMVTPGTNKIHTYTHVRGYNKIDTYIILY